MTAARRDGHYRRGGSAQPATIRLMDPALLVKNAVSTVRTIKTFGVNGAFESAEAPPFARLGSAKMWPRVARILTGSTMSRSSSWGCEDCMEQGRQDSVRLRIGQECGHVARCDNSRGRHATALFRVAWHPVIQSYEPGEDRYWRYLEQSVFELQGAPSAPSEP